MSQKQFNDLIMLLIQNYDGIIGALNLFAGLIAGILTGLVFWNVAKDVT